MAWFRRSTPTATRSSRSTTVTNSSEVLAIGEELLQRAKEAQAGMFSAKFWSDALVNWAMKDEKFKVQLFRFIDCFPVLKDSDQVYSHLKDYLTQPGVTLPTGPVDRTRRRRVAQGNAHLDRDLAGEDHGLAVHRRHRCR